MNHAGGATSAARSAISSAESEVRRIKRRHDDEEPAVAASNVVLVSALTLPVPAVTVLVEVQDSVVLAGNLI